MDFTLRDLWLGLGSGYLGMIGTRGLTIIMMMIIIMTGVVLYAPVSGLCDVSGDESGGVSLIPLPTLLLTAWQGNTQGESEEGRNCF